MLAQCPSYVRLFDSRLDRKFAFAQIHVVRQGEYKIENISGFRWTFACATIGLAVSVSLCFPQGGIGMPCRICNVCRRNVSSDLATASTPRSVSIFASAAWSTYQNAHPTWDGSVAGLAKRLLARRFCRRSIRHPKGIAVWDADQVRPGNFIGRLLRSSNYSLGLSPRPGRRVSGARLAPERAGLCTACHARFARGKQRRWLQ
jgi:hypothetical protein